ncbi:MAG TPA: hypothetical protein VGE72_30560 [Azospirillum sp.]
MTRDRRRRLAKAVEMLDAAKGIIGEVRDEERVAFATLPDSVRHAGSGQAVEAAAAALDTAYGDADELFDLVADLAGLSE